MLGDLKTLLEIDVEDDSEDKLLELLLEKSKAKILQRLYPFDTTKTHIPDKYQYRILDIAVYLYNRMGVEGQTYHKEGEISRGYKTPDIPPEMLYDIIPYIGVI